VIPIQPNQASSVPEHKSLTQRWKCYDAGFFLREDFDLTVFMLFVPIGTPVILCLPPNIDINHQILTNNSSKSQYSPKRTKVKLEKQ